MYQAVSPSAKPTCCSSCKRGHSLTSVGRSLPLRGSHVLFCSPGWKLNLQLPRNRQREKEKVVLVGQVRTEIPSLFSPPTPVGKDASSCSNINFAVTFTASVVWKRFSGISACPCWLMPAFSWRLCIVAAALLLEHNPAYTCFSASHFWLKKG